MQALCVRLAVSDAIIAYLFGYIRSFFHGRYCRGIRGTSLLYIFWSITFFNQAIRENGIAQTCIYIIYILFCLIGFIKFLGHSCGILFEKIGKTLSILLYNSFHFNCVFFFFSYIHTYTFIVFALIFTFLLPIFFFLYFKYSILRWDDEEFYTTCHTTSWKKAEKKRLVRNEY